MVLFAPLFCGETMGLRDGNRLVKYRILCRHFGHVEFLGQTLFSSPLENALNIETGSAAK